MKKIFIFAPIAALAMASCSSDSVVEQNPSKVAEANALQIFPDIQGTTRGTVWDNGNFAEFHLKTSGAFIEAADADDAKGQIEAETAAPATIDKDVTKAGGAWKIAATPSTDNLYFWPSKSSESKFTAWAPKEAAAGTYEAYGANGQDFPENTKKASATEGKTIADQQDIVVAFNEGKASDFETGVPLKFRHIMSQIVVKAINADADKVTIKVKGIRLNNIKTTGTWALPTASTVDALGYTPWSGQSTELNYVVTQASEVILGTSATDLTGSNPLLLIPQTLATADLAIGTKQYFSVLIQVMDGETPVYPNAPSTTGEFASQPKFAWVAVDVNGTWEPGKKYIYTLHFAKDSYGKVDKNTADYGNPDPLKNTGTNPGEDVVDTPVQLILDVEVMEWEEVPNSQNM